MDWGSNNIIAIALSGALFLWNAVTGNVQKLLQLPDEECITSVKWIAEGNVLAIGLDNGVVEVIVAMLNICTSLKK